MEHGSNTDKKGTAMQRTGGCATCEDHVGSMQKRKPIVLGCLAVMGIVGVLLAILIVVVGYEAKRGREEFERSCQRRRLETLAAVKSGRTHVTVWDAECLGMLADDTFCRENVESLYFFMYDLDDPRFRRVRELTNVINIGFYDCENADNVLDAAKDMPKIESLYFDLTAISSQSIQSLARFPNLKKIRYSHNMSREELRKLRKSLPNVEIQSTHSESKEPNQAARDQ